MIFLGQTLIQKFESEIAYLRERIAQLESREQHFLDSLLRKAGSYPIPEQTQASAVLIENRPEETFDLESVYRNDFILEAQENGHSLEEAANLWEAKKEKRWTPPGQLGT